MNQLRRYSDPNQLWTIAKSHLLADEARYCMIIGIFDSLIKTPEKYPEFYLAAIHSELNSDLLGIIWCTPRHPIGFTEISDKDMDLFFRFALDLKSRPTGIYGAAGFAESFTKQWISKTGAVVSSRFDQRLYQLTKVAWPSPIEGKMRLANAKDRDLLTEWTLRFILDPQNFFKKIPESLIPQLF